MKRILEDDFSSKLSLLSERIIEKTNEYLDSGEADTIKIQYIEPKFDEFEYTNLGIRYSMYTTPLEVEEWDWTDNDVFIQKLLKSLTEYQGLISQISKAYPLPKLGLRKLDLGLLAFASNIAYSVYDGVISDTRNDYISTLTENLQKYPLVEWKCKSWVSGIWLEKDEYEITEGLKIRRPRPVDIDREWIFDLDFMRSSSRYFRSDDISLKTIFNPGTRYECLQVPRVCTHKSGFIPHLSAIVELTRTSRDRWSDIEAQVDTILNCLTLFGTGSVFAIQTVLHPKSFFKSNTTIIGERKIPSDKSPPPSYKYYSEYYNYNLDEQDIPNLLNLIERIERLYPRGITEVFKMDSPFLYLLNGIAAHS